MRSAIVQLPDQRTVRERRQVLRAAIRQLERADIYIAAVAYMDLGDPATERHIARLRAELDGLRRHIADERSQIRE